MRLFALLLLPLWSIVAAVTLHPTYRVSGTVHDARDGSMIPHARVRLGPTDDGAEDTSDNSSTVEVFSDESGHFAMTAPAAGRWVLSVSARGFHTQGYLQHEQFQSALVLSPNAPDLDLDLRIEPDASITGSVLDEAGEPVRDAQVTLFAAPTPESEMNLAPRGPLQVRTTDDLGHYELSGLEPGAYRVSVSAKPWYAAAPRPQQGSTSPASSALDVVYPTTWYPGAMDPEAADVLTLQPGDAREADVHLLALPATHLRVNVTSPPRTGDGAERRERTGLPQLERISGSAPAFVPPAIVFNEAGQAELGGLTPGLYRVRFPGSAAGSEPLFLRVTANSPREVDLASALPAVHIGFSFVGLAAGRRTQVSMTDVATGARFDFTPPSPDAPGESADDQHGDQRRRFPGRFGDGRTLDLPTGRYRVAVSGAEALYLTGIDATGASVRGNLIDLRETAAMLTLHVETDPATIRGICRLHGRPVAGAMVLLIPASLGQTGSIPVIRRDQSDSDGSFLLPHVNPGPYILVAIENGWSVNWRDAATLERYLLNGVPLSPGRGAIVRQSIDVQAP